MWMVLAHGPRQSREILDHHAGEWPVWDLNPHYHTAKLDVGPTLTLTIMRVKRQCRRGQGREGLFLTRGLKEGCVDAGVQEAS